MKQRLLIWLILWGMRKITSIPLPAVYALIQAIVDDSSNPITETQASSMKQMLAIDEVIKPCQ